MFISLMPIGIYTWNPIFHLNLSCVFYGEIPLKKHCPDNCTSGTAVTVYDLQNTVPSTAPR